MDHEALVGNLEKIGWAEFGPGEFLGVDLDAIGKAKVARNNWFVLIKSIPVLDKAGVEAWNDHYKHLTKKSQAGMFSSGKYFVAILLADTVRDDAGNRLSPDNPPGFLEMPKDILRGGGYILLVVKDQRRVLAPKSVMLPDLLRVTDFIKQTHQAVADYVHTLG